MRWPTWQPLLGAIVAAGCAPAPAPVVPTLSQPAPAPARVPAVTAAPPRAAAQPPAPARLTDPPPPLAGDARFGVEGRASPPTAGAHALVREPSGNVEARALSARSLACLHGRGAAYLRLAVTSGPGGGAPRVLASEGPPDAVACAVRAVVRELHLRPDDDPLEVEVLLLRP